MHGDRQSLLSWYRAVRSQTEALAAPLSPEDQTVQSMPDVSPTKWHRAHTTWFFETFLLGEFQPGYAPVDPDYAFLFNSYYEQAGPRHSRPQRGLITRPGAEAVGAYRAAVDERMARLIETASPADWPRIAERITLGLHHEMQHQELLVMDIKHVLSCNPTGPAYTAPPEPAIGATASESWVYNEGGMVEIGHRGNGFAFDNEGPHHQVFLRPFRLASRPETCGAWLEFMADGGYGRPELWLSEGWATVQAEGWQAPLYWRETDAGGWERFTLNGWQPVDPRAPVSHLSYFEADAYARWTGFRLPTEAEWEVAVNGAPVAGQFLENGAMEPRPALTDAPDAHGLRQAWGTVWEWTQSHYSPYPGYRTPPGAIGEYNGKFMVNQMVLRGGCAWTPKNQMRTSYRNFFPAGTRWHCSGVRLAQDVEGPLV
ncbi:MAG: ergothioneine biosynthesis protein EgtB [Alphaproteobacteria bacterium]|nr:ergothioneine biosynthesis protein EgtB [Alphaproteobacteria bacterium]MCB9930568.1 ergothioneine biosynthesis protein EgtB [Alphaproteobacteria bacterium]